MFSIIIPTYNRFDILDLTIKAYLNQTFRSLIREIIVINDGSADDTESRVAYICGKSPIKIKYIFQENEGPAVARNRGVNIASGEILLITGDDIIPHPDMIKEHFIKHKSYNFDENICVLGHIAWPENMKITPFMEYIQEMGFQFGYSIINDPEDVPFNFFYTSNISLHRNFLLADKLFDTDFPFAGWEDIELGYRLKKRGLRIVYSSRALGYHNHNISFASFRRRQEKCGYAAYIFYKKHPELGDFLGINNLKNLSLLSELQLNITEIFCLFADKHFKKTFPKCYEGVMNKYYKKGIIKGKK
jgi:glycosyltransferase involved in cell wall biosynthesis